MDDILAACRRNNPDFDSMPIERILRLLQDYTGFEHVQYDACRNSCVCFVSYSDLDTCPVCNKNRRRNGKPVTTFDYISLIHRFKAM